MRKYQLFGAVGVLLVIVGFSLLLQSQVFAQDAQEATPEPMVEPPFLAEYYHAWVGSAHANTKAEAFNHWNSEGEVPVECARCHSTPGYVDYVGGDGTAAGTVDNPAPIGTTVTCDACHNPAAAQLTSVEFPSGAVGTDVKASGRCMVCHQGRASADSVNAAIEKVGLTNDPNTVNADLGFINIHYYAAAATLFGGEARGGYQFEGKVYQGRNFHVPGYTTCADCHNQHTLEVRVDECATCHEDVKTKEDLRFIRMNGSLVDYDGDGDDFEGIAEEIAGLQELAYQAIQTYAREISGTPIIYDASAYPYFFADANDNGQVDEGEGAYKSFTPNLLKAAYNYQVTIKDPGGFAHNPKYLIELLYDTTEMLNSQISEPVDLTTAHRDDVGHFNITDEPFRHWDAEGEVPATCSRCHTAGGLPFYLENGVNIKSAPSQSLACTTCHDVQNNFDLYPSDKVTFPSGATVTFGEGNQNNLCLNCHQGRESTVSVNAAISRAGVGPDEVTDALAFRNVHYFAAGASLFGTEVKGAYEFDGKEYNGRNMHVEDFQACSDCHDVHSFQVRVNDCADCHENVETQEDLRTIRQEAEDVQPVDYDGDGDTTEPIADEIASFQEALLAGIQKYAADVGGAAIAYDAHTHPYWYIDTNGNGTADEDEVNADNRYVAWTPNLLRAAYNYQYSVKDPGVFAHNPDYILQVLYDSVETIAGADAVANFTRPPVTPPASS
jgi:hypothetical protein